MVPMDILQIFPADVMVWLTRYGLFLAFLFFVIFLFLVLMRPFFLWWSGLGELKEKAAQNAELNRKILLELEVLNKTLTIPVKRAQKKAREAQGVPAEPVMTLSQNQKEEFLKALEKSRERLKTPPADEDFLD